MAGQPCRRAIKGPIGAESCTVAGVRGVTYGRAVAAGGDVNRGMDDRR